MLKQKQAHIYLTDKKSGESVRIPAGRLKQYQKAQEAGAQRTSEAELRRMMEKFRSL